ncbi:MBL fold metallo-hydrolase [Methylobacterium oryzihabitans]|uniref:GAF domain-containing protein n=1 Tax=Methylobacterium oryzihabitans TaxID=2499852 RepID=A0A437PC12_9HYPH|nr:MBL fold metallo-hydrolase [Methylobacterium oryzihabitans]RVU19796.1 GAF domain-containing protein [Methylobacterium oryzihabitans]
MLVRFYGTRGSLPVPGPGTVRYGGNTSCVCVRSRRGTLVVLDIGTGAYALGRDLTAKGLAGRGHLLITHTHWDHIQGLPFFAPLFVPGNEWDIYAPRGLGASLRETLSGQMQHRYFPVSLDQLGATIRYHELVEGSLALGPDGDVAVEARYLNHPALTLGYRLQADGASLVYALDHEPYAACAAEGRTPLRGPDRRHAEFLDGADLVIHDAQYTAEEYRDRQGWGHSTVEYALRAAKGARRLALMHHDPLRDDDALDALVARYRATSPGPDLIAAAEGLSLDLTQTGAAAHRGGASAERAPDTARTEAAVVLAAADPALGARIAGLLAEDEVPVHAVAVQPEAVRAAVARHRPALVVLTDGTGTGPAVAAICDALGAPGSDPEARPALVLAAAGTDPARDEALGLADRLAAPFTDAFARTRLRAWLMRETCRWERAVPGPDEAGRLAAVAGLALLDTPAEERFDRIVRLAAEALATPYAALTLIDRDRQWFKASIGLGFRESARDLSLCDHAVAAAGRGAADALVVPDTHGDGRFADNPVVTGPPHIRFYAGQPLVLAGGHCIGTLCVADTRPRDPDGEALAQLRRLAGLALAEAEGR